MDYKEKIQTSLEYIEENLSEKILLDNLAKDAFLSKYHYHRLFHEIIGETVMSYIRKRRLNEAAKELIENNSKIVDIALKYQFGSQEAFSRAFKKMFKVSPGEYRRAKVDLYHGNITTPRMVNSMCKAA